MALNTPVAVYCIESGCSAPHWVVKPKGSVWVMMSITQEAVKVTMVRSSIASQPSGDGVLDHPARKHSSLTGTRSAVAGGHHGGRVCADAGRVSRRNGTFHRDS